MSRYQRKPPSKAPKDSVLIVCGGQTEKVYFECFKKKYKIFLGDIQIEITEKRVSPLQIVEYTRKIASKGNYIDIWCVFDKDEFTNFDLAIETANRYGIRCAFSNQAFEVWFINHFDCMTKSLHRSKYAKILSQKLTFEYNKELNTTEKTSSFLLTEELTKAAINNCRIGYERHKVESVTKNPSEWESCSAVYQLASSLLKWSES